VTSLVLGAAYERTRNVVVPALLHGLYNATLLTLSYVAVVTG
jgi:membrane protease YdiL (CAAX protease family)